MSDNIIKAWRDNIDEVLLLKQLNIELLEALELTVYWFKDYQKRIENSIPNLEVLESLARKASQLIDKICSTPNLQHRFRTPPDATEPLSRILSYFSPLLILLS